MMRSLKVGGTLELRLFRLGKYREVEYVLPERPLLPSDLPSECDSSSGSDTLAPPMRELPMQRQQAMSGASRTFGMRKSCR